jgi:hypothetical protein
MNATSHFTYNSWLAIIGVVQAYDLRFDLWLLENTLPADIIFKSYSFSQLVKIALGFSLNHTDNWVTVPTPLVWKYISTMKQLSMMHGHLL